VQSGLPAQILVALATFLRAKEAPPAQHGNAKEEAKIVPAAVVGHGIDCDAGIEERPDPAPREDKTVPQAPQKPGGSRVSANPFVNLAGTG